jgi:hypothetical protein
MSRKLFNHFVKSKYIDIYKDSTPPPPREIISDYWQKYLKRKFKK